MEESLRNRAKGKCNNLSDKIGDLITAGKFWKMGEEETLSRMEKQAESRHNQAMETDIPNIQMKDGKPLLLGSDVVALYPSLDPVSTAEITYEAVLKSNIEIEGIDFARLSVYLLLTHGEKNIRDMGLECIIPKRLDKSKARSLSATLNRNLNNWEFNTEKMVEMDPDELYIIRRKMIAAMVRVLVLVLFNTTCYSFGGDLYRQVCGAGIGLRGAAVLAKLVMAWWDDKWVRSMKLFRISCQLLIRYIDDIRIYLKPIQRGWFWGPDGWYFDNLKLDARDDNTRTLEEVCKSMNAVLECLNFTMESE